METLSEKSEAKYSARDGLSVEDGSEVVYLRCTVVRSLCFSRGDVGWGLMTE